MFPTDKEISKLNSEKSSERDITYVFKSLRNVFNAFSHQKLTFEGNQIMTLSTRAKLYPPLMWILLVSLCFWGGINIDDEQVTNLIMSSSPYLILMNMVIILSSSIFSSTFKYCQFNLKHNQNTIYLDNKLKIPSSWFEITRYKVTFIFVLCIIFDAYVWVYNFVLWYDKNNR